jgi:hypothetical protein
VHQLHRGLHCSLWRGHGNPLVTGPETLLPESFVALLLCRPCLCLLVGSPLRFQTCQPGAIGFALLLILLRLAPVPLNSRADGRESLPPLLGGGTARSVSGSASFTAAAFGEIQRQSSKPPGPQSTR